MKNSGGLDVLTRQRDHITSLIFINTLNGWRMTVGS